ncbi:hypothetical protein Nos7524_4660 [Nostoc sp. PCC 7524]|uniref:hypothetical protein n=1 Tax=Nostoc sp. (strain ATCC 29411 / PCC 7524) TaxID=28072 RepID=UPI00029F02F5|nr:hypothetical protein [Nostoc sp. PCC 7524]AFY50405.1 hypothetical protein Nos7524_4660 [Nostoc sp. PCC 7524]
MKSKLLNVLTVCLVAYAVVSPGLVVFRLVWEKHTEFVKTQKSTHEVNKLNLKDASLSIPKISENSSQALVEKKLPNRKFVNQMLTNVEHYKVLIILQWFIILIPVFIGLGIIIYDRYLMYRAGILQEQIEMLERLWQQGIEQ